MNLSKLKILPFLSSKRALSSSSVLGSEKEGFFNSLFGASKPIEAQSSSHSHKLSARDESMIEFQTHNVKPDCLDKYLKAHQRLCEFIAANENEGLNLHCTCIGNFTVFVGLQDQFVHLWKFRDGFRTLDNEKKSMETNSEYK